MVMCKVLRDCGRAVGGGKDPCLVCVHDGAQRFTVELELVQEEFYIFNGEEAVCVVNIGHNDGFSAVSIVKKDPSAFAIGCSEEEFSVDFS